MITLLSAVAFLCFDAVNSLTQRIITAFGWAVFLLPTTWIIIRNWEPGDGTCYSLIWNIWKTIRDQKVEIGDGDGDEEGNGIEIGVGIGEGGRVPTVNVALLETLLVRLCGAVE